MEMVVLGHMINISIMLFILQIVILIYTPKKAVLAEDFDVLDIKPIARALLIAFANFR